MFGSLIVSVHAQARDRAQKIPRSDIGAHLAGSDRRLKKGPKCRFQSLLEIRGQGVEGRVSRVQRRGESALGRDEVHVTLHPSSQRLAWLVLGSQNRRGVCAGIDFTTEDGRDEVGALRKVAVNSPDADAGLVGDLSYRSVHSRGCEHRHGRLEQRIDVALRVGTHRPIRAVARLRTRILLFRFAAHHNTLAKRNTAPYKRNDVPLNTIAQRGSFGHSGAGNKDITMQDKPVALVTGANQGIGLQIAKDLAAHGFTVLVGSRNFENGQTAAKSVGADARAVQLDVTDQASITAAAKRIRSELGRLDVLVNNAAISNTRLRPGESVEEYSKSTRPSVVSLAELRAVFETNVFGVIAVTQAMLPLLRGAPAARIVNVSSGAGSLTRNSDPAFPSRSIFGPVYPASKTALNAMTLAMAIELESTGIKVNAACPGFTKTNLNNYAGTQTVEEGAREPVRLALLGPDGPTGTFSNAAGVIPW
jgi:NAD(P)-dependent dehydrogenase (short-subunit alcohol dehydrogenase family)